MLQAMSTKQGTATRAQKDLLQTEGEATGHHPHHDGPQSLPHFRMATCQRSVWLASASHRHLAWEKPPS